MPVLECCLYRSIGRSLILIMTVFKVWLNQGRLSAFGQDFSSAHLHLERVHTGLPNHVESEAGSSAT